MASQVDIDYDALDPRLISSEPDDRKGEGVERSDTEYLNLLRQAEAQATTLQAEMVNRWQRAYRAMRNEHSTQSKYLSDTWSRRSKLFVPRTRSAIEKIMVTAAGALFSTQDVVNIEPQNPESLEDQDAALIMQELINVRLDRATGKTSIPWFQTAMGARHDAAVTGVCCSYQHWLYEAEEIPPDPEAPPSFDLDGNELEPQPTIKVIQNRPEVTLIAPEHVKFSSGADWHRIAQSSPYLILDWPMFAQDILRMCRPGNGRTVAWRDITEEDILSAVSSQKTETTGVRSAREGRDRYNDPTGGDEEWRVLWPRLVFMRLDGMDMTFWALGTSLMLSDPQPVEEVYPEQGGERPVVIGTDRIEPHKLYPMSLAEGLQPLQQEINDIRNLRLDAVKMATYPPKSIIRGRNVDFKQLAQYGPDTKWLVQNHEDVQERQSPGPHPSSFNEMDRLNNDFDDVAGLFNTGTVQSQRNLNETVGGMRLMNANASAVSEFSLRVWVETWVEPVLGQIVRMESYFEDDKTVLALAAQKAPAFQRFGITPDLDDLLMRQMLVRVNVGIGSVNPAEKLAKFAQAAQITGQVLGAKFQSGEIDLKAREIVAEIWGPAGFRDAADRFLIIKDPQEMAQQGGGQQNPEAAAAQAEAEAKKAQAEAEIAMKRDLGMEELKQEKEIALEKLRMEQQTAITIARIKANADVVAKRDQIGAAMGAPGSAAGQPQAPGAPMEGEGMEGEGDMAPGPSILDVMSQQIAAQGQQIAQAVQAIAMVAQAMQQTNQAIAMATQAMAAPKRVMRDETGRIVGTTMQ